MNVDVLERVTDEISALEMIYEPEEEDTANAAATTTQLKNLTLNEFNKARALIEENSDDINAEMMNYVFTLEFNTQFVSNERIYRSKMHVTLPVGYPEHKPASVSIVKFEGLNRAQRDDFGQMMNDRCSSFIGQESVMELVQIWQDRGEELLLMHSEQDNDDENDEHSIEIHNAGFKRMWIWVHHITNVERRKSIVREATSRRLCGYLKHGYPGVVVIEGDSSLCDEYVKWIKGNKSMEGGFGRNWGHHVRGDVKIEDEERAFSNIFQDIGEDLSDLAQQCRGNNVEDEFRKFVMQH